MKFIKNMTTFLLCLIEIFIIQASLNSQTENTSKTQAPLELRYIANEAVMLSSASQKVLIDALFVDIIPDYQAPSKETTENMIKGLSPFENVTLVLVSHNHPDHFDPALAVQFMENRPQPLLIAPADAVSALQEKAKDWNKIRERIISLDLKPGETAQRNLQGITVQAFRTLHSGDKDSPANLMYLIEMGGWRIFHEGDSNANLDLFRKFEPGKNPIHLALVHFWFPLDLAGEKIILEVLKPEHVALIHLPKRLENDAPGKIDMVRKHYKDIFLLLPQMEPKVFYRQPN